MLDDHRLARARFTDEQHATRRGNAEAFEFAHQRHVLNHLSVDGLLDVLGQRQALVVVGIAVEHPVGARHHQALEQGREHGLFQLFEEAVGFGTLGLGDADVETSVAVMVVGHVEDSAVGAEVEVDFRVHADFKDAA